MDYDNLEVSQRSGGLSAVADAICTTLGPKVLSGFVRVEFRLYGGWHDGVNPTRASQSLSAQCQKDFPRPYSLRMTNGIRLTVTLGMELAYGLMGVPHKAFQHTYRNRAVPSGLFAKTQSQANCALATCGLDFLSAFITSGLCREAACGRKLAEVMYKGEQKLVDTLLLADMHHVGTFPEKRVCVATSDDDVVPGVWALLSLGSTVYHVHTKKAPLRSDYRPPRSMPYQDFFL